MSTGVTRYAAPPGPEVPPLPPELVQQIDLAFRLVLAAVLGGAIGFEREIHEHPAGMRTHLLVALGAATFTVLSIVAFELPPAPNGSIPTDPSRVAAQIVSGIGFLGAGAILKYGTTIKGLTTAASLWATAAVGMGAGAGAWIVSVTGTAIIILSLWPLRWLIDRFRLSDQRQMRIQLGLTELESLGAVMGEVHRRRLEIVNMATQRVGKGRYEVELHLRIPAGSVRADIVQAMGSQPGVTLLAADQAVEG
jgi:putative Mg2+ transporter-C (MgtC) family protein